MAVEDIRHNDERTSRSGSPSTSTLAATTATATAFGVAECSRGRTTSGAVLDTGDKRATLRMGEFL